MRERCPGCGAEAAYVGLTTIECHTVGCAHYHEPVIEAPVAAPPASAEARPASRTEAAQAIAQQAAEELLDSFAFF